jgi:hypothetical protein
MQYKEYANRREYTKEEIQYLAESFDTKTSIEVGRELGRNPASIRNYWIKLGLRRKPKGAVRKPIIIGIAEKQKATIVAMKIARKLGLSLGELFTLTNKHFKSATLDLKHETESKTITPDLGGENEI